MEPLVSNIDIVAVFLSLFLVVIGFAALCFSWTSHRNASKWAELVRVCGSEERALELLTDLEFKIGMHEAFKRGWVK